MEIGRFQPAWTARGSITDPEIYLDTPLIEPARVVARPTRLDLFDGIASLFFDGPQYVPITLTPQDVFPHDALRYFLIYQTRVNYNILHRGTAHLLPPPSTEVRFDLMRANGAIGEPQGITISAETLEAFLRVGSHELDLAIAYYLVGCDQPQYFLIEYYKAMEVIENVFGGEGNAIDALKPHGVVPSSFKTVKRLRERPASPAQCRKTCAEARSRSESNRCSQAVGRTSISRNIPGISARSKTSNRRLLLLSADPTTLGAC